MYNDVSALVQADAWRFEQWRVSGFGQANEEERGRGAVTQHKFKLDRVNRLGTVCSFRRSTLLYFMKHYYYCEPKDRIAHGLPQWAVGSTAHWRLRPTKTGATGKPA